MVLSLKNISCSYSPDIEITKNVSLSGEKVGVVALAENWSDKSTLLHLESAYIVPTSGQVYLLGYAVDKRIGFIFKDPMTSSISVVQVQAQILKLVKTLQDALNLTMLFITQDLPFITQDLPAVRQICDRIAVMQRGKVFEV